MDKDKKELIMKNLDNIDSRRKIKDSKIPKVPINKDSIKEISQNIININKKAFELIKTKEIA